MHLGRFSRILITISTAFAVVLLVSGVALAAGAYPGGITIPPTVVKGVHFARGPLTKTGSDTVTYLIIAAVVLAAGLALRMVARARAARRA